MALEAAQPSDVRHRGAQHEGGAVSASVALAPPPRPAARPAHREPWPRRLLGAFVSFLPLLLMLLLALGTWWLVKNSPGPAGPARETPLRTDPDYTMTGFAIERFDARGELKLRLEGALMRHLPATDRIEIDEVRIRAISPDGRVTLAQARQAVAHGDGSEVQLIGGATVNSVDTAGVPLEMRSEFLHAFLLTERVVTNQPVEVVHGGSVLRAAGLVYDHPSQKLDLAGPTRLVLPPRAR
jgi:lipopolysaccharide export system protein LptC